MTPYGGGSAEWSTMIPLIRLKTPSGYSLCKNKPWNETAIAVELTFLLVVLINVKHDRDDHVQAPHGS